MIQISAELLSLSSDPALLARNGKILYANAAACRLLGQDCAGKPLQSVLGREAAGVQAPSFVGEAMVAGQRLMLRVSSAEGTRAYFLSPSESAADQYNESFLFYLRSSLMDLNLSLTVLRSRLELIPDEALHDSILVLTRNFFRLNRVLVNATLVQAAHDGDLIFQPVTTDLAALLRDVADAVGPHFPAYTLRVQAPETLMVSADPVLIRHLLYNLLSNCVRHAEGCRSIQLTLHDSGERVLLSVSDDGRGISSELLPTVFERYRHRFSLSDAGTGVGLGLSAAREVSHIHGGTLLLESREGAGTAVRVSLSKTPQPIHPLGEPRYGYIPDMDHLTVGLADCLPGVCFSEKYMD